MKKIKTLFIVLAAILISSLFFSCQKDGNDPIATDNEVSFAINVSNLKSATHLKSTMAYSLTDADKIILTIQNSDGSPTKYTSAEVNIEIMNGQYFTKKIVLKNGSYNLTEFLVVDQTGNTILAIPSAGSLMAQNVALSLPIAFSASKDNTTPVNVEVLSTEMKTPEDFGLNRFPIAEVKTFSFLIGVADSETDELLTATLSVSNGSYAYNQDLDASMSNVVTVKDDLSDYTLTVVKSGYNTNNQTYSIDDLKLYLNAVGNLPLLVELEKANELTVTDIDGNIYQTVTIGTQVWMAENLKVTRYRNGDAIPNVTDNSAWAALTTGAYCWYNNDYTTYGSVYGALYNWYTVVDSRNIAPTGWHVPSDAEWTTLTTYLGGESVDGGKLKETGTTHWTSPNSGATNECGFTALPGGNRSNAYYLIGDDGDWWSSSEFTSQWGWFRSMHYYGSGTSRLLELKELGFSVRCVRD